MVTKARRTTNDSSIALRFYAVDIYHRKRNKKCWKTNLVLTGLSCTRFLLKERILAQCCLVQVEIEYHNGIIKPNRHFTCTALEHTDKQGEHIQTKQIR